MNTSYQATSNYSYPTGYQNLENIDTQDTNSQMFYQIENMIQQQLQVNIPSLVIEYRQNNDQDLEFAGWDQDDLTEFFAHFGKIEMLEVYGKISVILFRTFVDAYTCDQFLQNSSNFKETEQNRFTSRWLTPQDMSFLSDNAKLKIGQFGQTTGYYANNMNNLYFNNSMYSVPYNNENFNSSNLQTNSYSEDYENQQAFTNKDNYLQNGKYTCKFDIKIENDNEFQVARRVIGAKGCNMKRIVDFCSRGPDGKYLNDAVKLRLRGRGSGYKEGPYNQESDEPLHLCISSKYQDKYKKACSMVQELISSIYDEFKRFCERNGRISLYNLALNKEEAVTSHRGNGYNY